MLRPRFELVYVSPTACAERGARRLARSHATDAGHLQWDDPEANPLEHRLEAVTPEPILERGLRDEAGVGVHEHADHVATLVSPDAERPGVVTR